MQSALKMHDERGLHREPSSQAPREDHGSSRLEALGMMTAGIVHDLGNVIQILSSTVELLDRHPDIKAATSLRPPMRRALNSVARADALIEQILRFARGTTTLHERVDLKQCLVDMKPLLRWIGNNRMRIDIHVDVDTPPVDCNRSELENAILNLALNARDATPERGTLSITARPRRNGAFVQDVAISVADTGRGMSSQAMARAFEPFFTTKSAASGSGLGLTMVRRFAQEAGGGVAIESRIGVGTTVTLRLPIRSGDKC